MNITPDAARQLAAALLQLIPLLGFSLLWSEKRLAERESVNGKPKVRGGNKQKSSIANAPGFFGLKFDFITYFIFFHTISWSIKTIALPDKASLVVVLLNSFVFMAIALSRILAVVVPDQGKSRFVAFTLIAIAWLPLYGLTFGGWTVGSSPVNPAPAPSVPATPSTAPSPRLTSIPPETGPSRLRSTGAPVTRTPTPSSSSSSLLQPCYSPGAGEDFLFLVE